MKKFYLLLTRIALLLSLVGGVLAADAGKAKAQYEADGQSATARYESDKQLCTDEASSSARLQCRRDAKAEYDKAMASAKSKLTAASQAPEVKAPVPQASCADCGKVVAVTMAEKAGEGGAVGMVAGGVAGALLGRQVGGGFGKDLATIAGAAGGAYAGKQIEGKMKTHKVWTVSVQYAKENTSSFEFDHDPGFKVGDTVKNSGNTIVHH